MESLKDWAYVVSHGAMAIASLVSVFWMATNWKLGERGEKPVHRPVVKLKQR